MPRTVSIGLQSFEKIHQNNCFYVDKTAFLKEWWENGDDVTLITRPRRFGKTLTMNMVKTFFSLEDAGKGELFEGLSIWEEDRYRTLQGTYPVIFLSFADVKQTTCESAQKNINQSIASLYSRYSFLKDSPVLTTKDRGYWERVSAHMSVSDASLSLHNLSEYLSRYYQKKVIILLDEYDTPMHEAYVYGYWEEMAEYIRGIFNSTFKTNPYLERALMTGITRISKESIFSDLNNLEVVTTVSEKYESSFGFTQEEVDTALAEYGLSDQRDMLRDWYDGFTFGRLTGIYNPWSMINYLDKRKFAAYWANTSSNSLVGQLLRQGSRRLKEKFEDLLKGKTIHVEIDEQIIFQQLDESESAVWNLLLAAGYLKVVQHKAYVTEYGDWVEDYELALTNFEVKSMYQRMIRGWFKDSDTSYHDFVEALLQGDLDLMEWSMNEMCKKIFSYFDTGKGASDRTEPERFYHGFVLGLMMDLNGRFIITSNRESGFGRYDIQMEPREQKDPAIIIEFKVFNPKKENVLSDTVAAALQQIREKEYAALLEAKGIPPERIRVYGFAFEGKKVQIGQWIESEE